MRPAAPEPALYLLFLFQLLSSHIDCGAQQGTDFFSYL